MTEPPELLPALRDLSPRQFEQLVADTWQEAKDWSTEVMPPGPDRGIDVLGNPPNGGPQTAFQVKRYGQANKVSSREVQQYASLTQMEENIENVTIVTTSSFTTNAREMAEDLGIKCINGPDLVQKIEHYNAEPVATWYLNGKPGIAPGDSETRFGEVGHKGSSDVGEVSLVARIQSVITHSNAELTPLLVSLAIAAYLLIAQPLSGSLSGLSMNWVAIAVILIGGGSAAFD